VLLVVVPNAQADTPDFVRLLWCRPVASNDSNPAAQACCTAQQRHAAPAAACSKCVHPLDSKQRRLCTASACPRHNACCDTADPLPNLLDVSQSLWYSDRSPPSTDRNFCVVCRITFWRASLSVTPVPYAAEGCQ
jgi:hypothetical protein